MYIGMGADPSVLTVPTYGDSPPPGTPTYDYVNAVTLQRGINAALGGNVVQMQSMLNIPAGHPGNPDYAIGGAFTNALNSLIADYNALILGPSASQGSVAIPSSHVYGVAPAPLSGTVRQAITVLDLQKALVSATRGDIGMAQSLLQRADIGEFPMHMDALRSIVAKFEAGTIHQALTVPIYQTTVKLAPPPKFEASGATPSPESGAVTVASAPFTALLSPLVGPRKLLHLEPSTAPAPASPLQSVYASPLQDEILGGQQGARYDRAAPVASPMGILYNLVWR